MNKGVQILLARMESHPQEFNVLEAPRFQTSPWHWIADPLIRRVRDDEHVPLCFLTDEEVTILFEKLMSVQGDAFTRRVMRQLLDGDQTPVEVDANDSY